ncbi:hypothetical protein HPG69_007608, partial [Diceros bicornis minor]
WQLSWGLLTGLRGRLDCTCERLRRALNGSAQVGARFLPESLHPSPGLGYRARFPGAPPQEVGAGGLGQRNPDVDLLCSGQQSPPPMGNSHCVPQAPRRLRASLSRKPSLKGNREDGARKLAGLFGTEAGPDGDTTADKIFYYIPGTDIQSLESQRENLEQPFLSVFKKGRRRVPVRTLGKVVHYAKVQLRFQHSQDTSDCYLELFPSHLYFQAHGSKGLTFQEQWDRLLVLYPTSLVIFSEEADGLSFKGELPLSAVHINLEEKEKQIRSFLIEGGLRWGWEGRREPGGCPTLQWVLAGDPCPPGPSWCLCAGHLINTIRVLCASYEDYSHWLLCLQTVSRREGPPPLPGPEGFLGLRMPTQVVGGGRGSLSSDGRTSWDSGCPAPLSSHTSHSLPEYSAPSTTGCPAQPAPDQTNPGCTSSSGQRAELRRGGSNRSPRSKVRGERPRPATPLHLDLTKLSRGGLEGSPEATDPSLESPHSPLYVDPYTPPATSHHKITDVRGLDEVSPCWVTEGAGGATA